MFIMVGVWISPAVAAAVAAVLAFRAGWWVLPVVAACAVLAGVAVLRLARWRARKDAALWAAQRPAQLRAEPARPVAAAERPAIAPQVVNFNFYGADVTGAAAVIRQALPQGGEPDERTPG